MRRGSPANRYSPGAHYVEGPVRAGGESAVDMVTVSRRWARKLACAAAAACLVLGGVQGFAASFGTGTAGFGATSEIVRACGSGLTFGYAATFDAGISGYAVTSIDLSDIPAGCHGKSLTATFFSGDENAGGSVVSATLPASGTTESISVDPSSNTIDAGDVRDVSVVVS